MDSFLVKNGTPEQTKRAARNFPNSPFKLSLSARTDLNKLLKNLTASHLHIKTEPKAGIVHESP